MVGVGFMEGQLSDRIEGFILNDTEPALFCAALLALAYFKHDLLPISDLRFGVACHEIKASNFTE